MSYIPIRQPKTSKLLFKYDPERRLIEIQERGIKTTVNLNHIEELFKQGKLTEYTIKEN